MRHIAVALEDKEYAKMEKVRRHSQIATNTKKMSWHDLVIYLADRELGRMEDRE